MKLLDLLYANVYGWYYDMQRQGRNVNPFGLTAAVIGVGLAGWVFFGDSLYYGFYVHSPPPMYHRYIAGGLALLIAFVISQVYSKNLRFQKVHDKYVEPSGKPGAGALSVSFGFVFLPIILSIFWN